MRLNLFLASLLAAAGAAMAQRVSLNEAEPITFAQRVLPAVGPGSARINPAALAETRMGYGLLGQYRASSGKRKASTWQMAVALPDFLLPAFPIGLAAGFGGYEDNRRIDGGESLHQESDLDPGIAISFPRDRKSPFWGAFGMAFPRRTYNTFNVVKSRSSSMDLGALASLDLLGSRLRLGAAYIGADGYKVELPGGSDEYEIPGRRLLTAGWLSPGESVRIHWGWFSYDDDGFPEDEGIDGWEIEYCPIRILALKAEHTLLERESCLGVVVRPRIGGMVELEMEINLRHDNWEFGKSLEWFLGKPSEEGRGLSFAYSLAASF